MKTPKHAPGPWSVGTPNDFVFPIVKKDNPYIAAVRFSDNPLASKDIAKANAHLISAAPDMFEALETLLAEIESQGINGDQQNKTLILNALKKARGES